MTGVSTGETHCVEKGFCTVPAGQPWNGVAGLRKTPPAVSANAATDPILFAVIIHLSRDQATRTIVAMSEPTSDPTVYPAGATNPTISYPPVAQGRGGAGWMAPVALVVSLLAAGAAIWGLLKPAPQVGNPAVADPKAQACSAFFLVSNGVALQSRLDAGPDPVAQQAIAANARLAMSGGADYLRSKMASNLPAELAGPLTSFADQLQTISQYYLAGQNNENPEQAARLAEADKSSKNIAGLCK